MNKKPKRQWLRFSLRTLLIVLAIFCVWFGWYLYRVERQREVVRWVRENGGNVWYGHEIGLNGDLIVGSQPPVEKWLLDLLGVDYFSTVTHVKKSNTELSDVTPLASLKNLRFLNLSFTQVSDLSLLVGLTNLEYLDLLLTQVSDAGPLAGLTNLEYLDLSGTPVSDVAPLAGLVNLKYLSLSNTQVRSISPLAGLTNLEALDLSQTQVSDVTPLAGLTNLRRLVLRSRKVRYEGIEKLKQALPNCNVVRPYSDYPD